MEYRTDWHAHHALICICLDLLLHNHTELGLQPICERVPKGMETIMNATVTLELPQLLPALDRLRVLFPL
jgi:hypothetical protein